MTGEPAPPEAAENRAGIRIAPPRDGETARGTAPAPAGSRATTIAAPPGPTAGRATVPVQPGAPPADADETATPPDATAGRATVPVQPGAPPADADETATRTAEPGAARDETTAAPDETAVPPQRRGSAAGLDTRAEDEYEPTAGADTRAEDDPEPAADADTRAEDEPEPAADADSRAEASGTVEPEPADEPAPGIEPTTGAPFGALPQRAPVRQTRDSRPAAPTDGPAAPPDRAAPVEGVDEPAFWLPIEEVHWDGRPIKRERETWLSRWRAARAAAERTNRPPPPPRHPLAGLAGLVLFALAASFFARVSAGPLWLAAGHGERGVAIVSSCSGSGLRLDCLGRFSAASGWTSPPVPLVGVAPQARAPGARVGARMVNADAGKAYAETGLAARHLRWLLGLVAALGCGPGIVWATGARRLPEPRGRRGATLAALAVPVLLVAGFLTVAF
ncbi:hypothetical protein ACFFWC_16920 [Plantactinospora siamensis]|uniref:Uncharacterized protein n=1 Tax=Plantactinospora siamensis TaxID=555372 RepID=A0ABV6NV54_9ACTN